ncbi:hypothetical protein CLV47_10734 [Antricoccus suffuscus]|uniref:Uncharacterized protein n=1 Tax=Antricoccus suffuscus TaxID=1629062 RepID=A0A2T1A0R0_9ACTN|nr:hypothetical protein [Antricoccus suffuscus]PRZ41908.1 hypothetical protein CLV47_10734 [Antricoccus suffuscus]
MNYLERVALVSGASEVEAPATVALVSAQEAYEVFLVTDVSVRVPPGFAVLGTTDSVRVLTGPLAGTYRVTQVRPSRHHTRYMVARTTS